MSDPRIGQEINGTEYKGTGTLSLISYLPVSVVDEGSKTLLSQHSNGSVSRTACSGHMIVM